MDIKQITKPTHGSLEWQQVRHRNTDGQCVIGASEVSTIMGCNPYETIADIAIRKLLPPQTTDTNDAMVRGNVLEPALVTHAENVLGVELVVPEVMYNNGRFIATLDARGVTDPSIIVEAKTNNHWALGSELPIAWYWQAQAQMYCTDTYAVHFVVLDKNMRLGFDLVERNEDSIASMVEHVELFCKAVDEERLPHDMELTAPQVGLLHPQGEGETELDNAALSLIEEWGAVKDALKDLENKEKAIKDALANMLRDAEFGTVSGHRVLSFKTQTTKRFDTKALLIDHPQYNDKYTTQSSFRVLRAVK